MKKLWLIRGLPGSGKSTLATTLLRQDNRRTESWRHYEADMYFITSEGKYKWNKIYISEAHRWCQEITKRTMESAVDNIIVSNTFCTEWEAEPYIKMAKEFGYSVQIITCQGEFGSIHNIPLDAMDRMRNRFVPKLML